MVSKKVFGESDQADIDPCKCFLLVMLKKIYTVEVNGGYKKKERQKTDSMKSMIG